MTMIEPAQTHAGLTAGLILMAIAAGALQPARSGALPPPDAAITTYSYKPLRPQQSIPRSRRAAIVDPAAKRLLHAEKAVYLGAASYRATLTESGWDRAGASKPGWTATVQVTLRQPDLLRLKITNGERGAWAELLCDGTHFYMTADSMATIEESEYTNVFYFLMGSHPTEWNDPFIALLLRTGVPFGFIPSERIVSESLLPDAYIDGARFQMVRITSTKPGNKLIRTDLAIDPRTHLLRRASRIEPGGRGRSRVVVDLKDQQINPRLDWKSFQLTPRKSLIPPDVSALLRSVDDAYRKLQTFHADVSSTDNNQGRPTTTQADFTFQRPNRLAVTIARAGDQWRVVSDGQFLWVYSNPPEVYRREPAGIADPYGLLVLLSDGSSDLLLYLTTGSDFGHMPDDGMWLTAMDSSGTMDGVPVVKVALQNRIEAYTLYIGKVDHLLRRTEVMDFRTHAKTTCTFTHCSVNQPVPTETFQFHPPKGARVEAK